MGKVEESQKTAREPLLFGQSGPADFVPMSMQPYAGDRKVGLADVWFLLASHRILALAALVLSVVGIVGFTQLGAPTYESRAIVELGRVAQAGFVESRVIEDPSVVLQWLKEEYGLNDDDRPELPRLESVGHPSRSAQQLILLQARDRSPEGAREFLAAVSERLIERHNGLYEDTRRALDGRLRAVDQEISTLEAHVEKLAQLTTAVEDGGQAAVVAVERGVLLERLANLKDQRMNLASALSVARTHPTRILREPSLATQPLGFGFGLHLVVGLLVGVFAAVLVVFAAEAVSRTRAEIAVRRRVAGKRN